MVDIRVWLWAGLALALLLSAGATAQTPPPVPPPLTAPKVLDLSERNGELDTAQMKTADVSAVIVRASYGTERDSRALENVTALRAAGIPVAALYHEFDPVAGWPAQLATFTAVMRQAGVERGALWLGSDVVQPTAGARRFMAGLADAFPLKGGYRHLIYTDEGAWQALGRPAWGARYDLWVADDSSAAEPAVPVTWRTWRLWQYTAEGDGPANGVSSETVGISRFNGSSLQFESWLVMGKVLGGTPRALSGE